MRFSKLEAVCLVTDEVDGSRFNFTAELLEAHSCVLLFTLKGDTGLGLWLNLGLRRSMDALLSRRALDHRSTVDRFMRWPFLASCHFMVWLIRRSKHLSCLEFWAFTSQMVYELSR